MAKLRRWLPWSLVLLAVAAGSAALDGFVAAAEIVALFVCLVMLHPDMRR